MMKMSISVHGIESLINKLFMAHNSEFFCIYERKYRDKVFANYED